MKCINRTLKRKRNRKKKLYLLNLVLLKLSLYYIEKKVVLITRKLKKNNQYKQTAAEWSALIEYRPAYSSVRMYLVACRISDLVLLPSRHHYVIFVVVVTVVCDVMINFVERWFEWNRYLIVLQWKTSQWILNKLLNSFC